MQAKGGHVGLARATEFFPKLPNGNQRVARSACPPLATLTQNPVSSFVPSPRHYGLIDKTLITELRQEPLEPSVAPVPQVPQPPPMPYG